MEITKREILFSVIIFSIMLGIGLWLSNPILFPAKEKQLEIISAVQVDNDVNKFDYIGRTDVGDFLANGRILAIKPVSIPDIPGMYMVIEKEKERYTMHTRTVTTSDGKGHTHTRVETYWSWDHVSTDTFHCDSLEFLQKRFAYNAIKYKKHLTYYKTIKESSTIRYIYRTYPIFAEGCLQGDVSNKSYNNLIFTDGYTITDVIKAAENRITLYTFLYWFIWTLITAGLIIGFYYLENNWLEDNND